MTRFILLLAALTLTACDTATTAGNPVEGRYELIAVDLDTYAPGTSTLISSIDITGEMTLSDGMYSQAVYHLDNLAAGSPVVREDSFSGSYTATDGTVTLSGLGVSAQRVRTQIAYDLDGLPYVWVRRD